MLAVENRHALVSGDEFAAASRQGEKATASQDQTGKASTDDGTGDRGGERQDLGEKLVADDVVRHVRRMDNEVIECLSGSEQVAPVEKLKHGSVVLVMP